MTADKKFKISKKQPPNKIKSLRAISIRQPYVEAILNGKKKFEYRSTQTHVRGKVLIYAALGKEDDSEFKKFKIKREDAPLGLIVGCVDIVDCKFDKKSNIFGYVLKNPIRFKSFFKPKNHPQPRWFFPF